MNIEQTIASNTEALAALTAAVQANTAVLQEILKEGGTTKPVLEKPKKPKLGVVKPAEPEPEPSPEPEPETAPEPEPEPEQKTIPEPAPEPQPVVSRDEKLKIIKDTVRAAFVAAGANLADKKTEFEKLRDTFGVSKADELKDDQLDDFIAAVRKL